VAIAVCLSTEPQQFRRAAIGREYVLPLARSTIANPVVVIPDQAKEVGANVFEFIPSLGIGSCDVAMVGIGIRSAYRGSPRRTGRPINQKNDEIL
jgi:hypothetical protein